MYLFIFKKRITLSLTRALLALIFFVAPHSAFAIPAPLADLQTAYGHTIVMFGNAVTEGKNIVVHTTTNLMTLTPGFGEGFIAALTLPLDFITTSATDYAHFTTEVGQTVAQNTTDAAHSSADLYRGVFAFVATPISDGVNTLAQTIKQEASTAQTLAVNASSMYEDTVHSIGTTANNTIASVAAFSRTLADTTKQTFTTASDFISDTAQSITSRAQNTTLAFNPTEQTASVYGAATEVLTSGYNAIYNFWGNFLNTVTPTPQEVTTPSEPQTPTPPVVTTPQLGSIPPPLTPSGTTVVNRITQPVITRTIEHTTERVLSGITATDLATQIAELRSELLTEIAKGKTQATQDNNALYLAMAPMNRINNLSSVTISNPTITGASITGTTISGYLPSTGGTLSGDLVGSTGSFTTLGIGTTTPSDTFAVNGVTYLADVSAPAVTTNRLYNTSGSLYWNGSLVGGGAVGNWTASGSDVYRASGNVGIGTTSPYAKLSVVGEVVASYFTATSTTATSTFTAGVNVGSGNGYFVNGVPVVSGAAGSAISFGFSNIVSSSAVAFGYNNTSSSLGSTAFGNGNASSGIFSVAFGYTNLASGLQGNAIGSSNQATSTNTVAMGYSNTAGGNNSIALGNTNVAYASGSIAIGRNITNTTASSLMIGPSDAAKLTILSSGNVGIGTTSPYAALSVVGQVVASYVTATSTTATSTFANHISIGAGKSYRIDGNPVLSGSASALAVGINSGFCTSCVAVGYSNVMDNNSNIAMGIGNTSSGTIYATAVGNNNVSSGAGGLAFGNDNTASGDSSVAFGSINTASGDSSLALGLNNTASVAGSVAVGVGITNSTESSLQIGPSDAAKLTILSSGNVGIGTTSPYAKLSVVGQVVAANFTATSTTATSTIFGKLAVGYNQASASVNGTYFAGGLTSWLDNVGVDDVEIGLGRADNTTATAGSMIFGGRSRGTLAVPTAVSSGDTLLTIQAVGHDGTDFAKSSAISFEVDAATGANDMPGRIVFSTSADGAQTPTERLRIDSSGRLVQTGPNGTLTSFAQTISATGVAQTAKGISITGTSLGTISKAYGIEMNLGETGGGSRWMNLTGTPSGGIVMTNTAVGNPGITLISGTMNNIAGVSSTGIGVSMSSTATSSGVTLYTGTLSGVAAEGNFARFENSTGEKIVMKSSGNLVLYGGLIHPRGTIDTVENLAKYSEQFDQSGTWVNTISTVTANYTDGPDGTPLVADRVQGPGSGSGSIIQTISSVATSASRTFTVGVWVKNNTSSFATTLRIDSGNTTGTSTMATDSSALNKWRYFSVTQTFPSGSTGSPKVVIATTGSSDASFFGLNFSETTASIGYTATANNTVSSMRGGTINGRFLVTGANHEVGQIIRAGGNQGTTNLLEFQDNTGAALNVVTASGNVGIGTTSPLSTFVTVGSACISKGAGATALCSTTAGTITANVFNTAAADLAERYKTDDATLGAGEITMLDPNKSLSVMRASKDQDAAIFGVVSTEPGFLLGSYNTLNEASTTVPIALSGRVPVKVTNEGGDIKIGDKITLSSTPGIGMKAINTKAVIGTALENFSGTQGTILAFVNVTGTKLDPAISKGTIGDGQSSFWSIDDSSGRLKYIAALDLNDFDIVNVKAIRGSANKWSIDAFGRMVVEEIKTNKLCVGETCVDENMLKKILEKGGIIAPSTDPVSVLVSTPTPVADTSAPAPEPAPAISMPTSTPEVLPAPETVPVTPSQQTEAPIVEIPPSTTESVADITATTTP